MGSFLPDYLIREQAAVGALVAFGILRVIAAVIAFGKRWSISVVQKCFIALSVFYCLPEVIDYGTCFSAGAELEGKAIGCAIALFCAPILSHRLGFE
ncbi:hypothetical protein [Paraburkholderia domus]|uniref:hypothetical protein n=1 Tax=Paraburkholderia domus TaxID=2793075 RepID=UPI001B245E96|nr:hypothetical protein [Paraburkholderia domus]CAE6964495.1 hypothetical protein R70199_07587 [Paraburkholderia domus]